MATFKENYDISYGIQEGPGASFKAFEGTPSMTYFFQVHFAVNF